VARGLQLAYIMANRIPVDADLQEVLAHRFLAYTVNCAVGLVFDVCAVTLTLIPISSLHMSKTKKCQ